MLTSLSLTFHCSKKPSLHAKMSISSSTPSNHTSPTHGGFFLSEEEDYIVPFQDRVMVVKAKLDLKEEVR